jgi:ComF family protein
MKLNIKKICNWCLDWAMPRYCLGCDREGGYCCKDCFENKIIFRAHQVCPECRQINDTGKFCKNCQREWNLDYLLVAAEKNLFLSKMISEYKYSDVMELEKVLAKIFNNIIDEKICSYDLICCVPLAKKRYNWRGFNQAENMARIIAEKNNLLYHDLLGRKSFAKQQVGLEREQRLLNVKDVFALKININVVGKMVLIVDDVATTLATLNECAKVLKENGASEVMALVLARERVDF